MQRAAGERGGNQGPVVLQGFNVSAAHVKTQGAEASHHVEEVARLLAAYYRQWEQQGGPDAAGMLEALNKARCAMELSLKSGVMVRPGAAARYATQLRQLEGQAPPVMLDQLLLLAAAAAQAVACSTTVLEMMRMARLLSLAAMLQLRQEHLQHGVQLSEPERAKRMLKRDAVQALLEAELQRAGGAQIYHLTQRLHADAASNLLSPHVNDEFVSPLLTRVAELGGGSGSARALAPWLASKIEPFTDSLKEYFARRTDQVQWLVEHEMVGLPDSLSPAAAELASNNAVAARHLLEVANKMGRDKSLASGGTSGRLYLDRVQAVVKAIVRPFDLLYICMVNDVEALMNVEVNFELSPQLDAMGSRVQLRAPELKLDEFQAQQLEAVAAFRSYMDKQSAVQQVEAQVAQVSSDLHTVCTVLAKTAALSAPSRAVLAQIANRTPRAAQLSSDLRTVCTVLAKEAALSAPSRAAMAQIANRTPRAAPTPLRLAPVLQPRFLSA